MMQSVSQTAIWGWPVPDTHAKRTAVARRDGNILCGTLTTALPKYQLRKQLHVGPSRKQIPTSRHDNVIDMSAGSQCTGVVSDTVRGKALHQDQSEATSEDLTCLPRRTSGHLRVGSPRDRLNMMGHASLASPTESGSRNIFRRMSSSPRTRVLRVKCTSWPREGLASVTSLVSVVGPDAHSILPWAAGDNLSFCSNGRSSPGRVF